MVDASDLFIVDSAYKLLICKRCRCGVLPKHLKAHLRAHHVPLRPHIKELLQQVEEWADVAQDLDAVDIPDVLDKPIEGIRVFHNALQCRLDPTNCGVVCRNQETMRVHWQQAHKYSVTKKAGRPTLQQSAQVKQSVADHTLSVECQRLLQQGKGSRWIAIRRADRKMQAPNHDAKQQVVPDDTQQQVVLDEAQQKVIVDAQQQARIDGWNRTLKAAREHYNRICSKRNDKIAPEVNTETNPWLMRTGWVTYLRGCLRSDLLAVIAQPSTKELRDDKSCKVEAVLWIAMRTLVTKCQHTVAKSSQLMRNKVAQADSSHRMNSSLHAHHAYQDRENIDVQVLPWQQTLMFFVRTQMIHNWVSPAYRLGRNQSTSFQNILQRAQHQIEHGNVAEGDVNTPGNKLTDLETALLEFCIGLLNQRAQQGEYDMPLVCASAVLGTGNGVMQWMTADAFLPVLSRLIRIAQMMVIQYATYLAGNNRADDEDIDQPCNFEMTLADNRRAFSDSGEMFCVYKYRSISSQLSTHLDSPELNLASEVSLASYMSRNFMQQGTHSPMDWFYDLKAYVLDMY